jgi:hypothetical protein
MKIEHLRSFAQLRHLKSSRQWCARHIGKAKFPCDIVTIIRYKKMSAALAQAAPGHQIRTRFPRQIEGFPHAISPHHGARFRS